MPAAPTDVMGERVRCITFYSYKGGTGRTMALANVAVELAERHGKRVLAIDWDLDSPGLHFYFGHTNESLARSPGLLDYLDDSRREFLAIRDGAFPESVSIDRYITHPTLGPRRGGVDLMTCGRTDPGYFHRVEDFDWSSLYDASGGFWIVERLRREALAKYDVVLVDARAGRSEAAVVPLIHTPDLVVLLFGSNAQSLVGTRDIAVELVQHPIRRSWGRSRLRVLLAPSRVHVGSADFEDWMNGDVERAFSEMRDAGALEPELQPRGPRQFVFGIEPEASVGETIVGERPGGGRLRLADSYGELADTIAGLVDGRIDWRPEPPMGHAQVRGEIANRRGALSEAQDRDDRVMIALMGVRLSRLLLRTGAGTALAEARTVLAESLRIYRQDGGDRGEALASLLLGRAASAARERGEARGHLAEALAIATKHGWRDAEATVRQELGNVSRDEGEHAAAMAQYEACLKIQTSLGDDGGISSTLQRIAATLMDIGELDRARDVLRTKIDMTVRIGDVRGTALAYHLLGNIAALRSRTGEALSLFHESLAYQRQSRNPLGEAITLRRIGDCHRHASSRDPASYGEASEDHPLRLALNAYVEALRLAQDAGDDVNVQALHSRMGETLRRLGLADEAGEALRLAVGMGPQTIRPGELTQAMTRLVDLQAGSPKRFGDG